MNFWNNKKVLVTGAGGFIGSHLTEHLVKLGAHVKAFIRYNSRNDEGLIGMIPPKIKKEINVVIGDIQELESVHEIMRDIDIVFNLAASVGIPYSYVNPKEVININTMGTLNVLTAARKSNVEKIIQTSTSEVYGTAKYIPIDEEHPKQPQSPYSASKIAADAIALSFYNTFDLPVTIIRPFNTYGPRQSDRAVIPSIICQAMVENKINIGNTTTTRDFCFVEDTVNGFIKMAESNDSVGMEINIGTGKEISIADLIKKIIRLVGRDINIEHDEKRIRPPKSEVERLCANNKKAATFIGWEPKVSLTEGITITIEFVKNNKQMYFPGKYRI